MHYNFFAGKTDKIAILDFIFTQTDLQVYDISSSYGQHICTYKNSIEIAQKFNLDSGDKFSVCFQLWSPRHKGKPSIRKVALNPKYCNGHTFRYSTEGWGMIQLYFGGVANNILYQSHIGHFNEMGATKKEPYTDTQNMAPVSGWNWSEIQCTSRKLKYYIHNKLAVKNIGNAGILPAANVLIDSGTEII